MTLPGIPQLEATPQILRLLLEGITELQTQWKPEPDRWSLAEILEHIAHVEAHYFRAAVDALVGSPDAVIAPYDQNAYAAQGLYQGREAEDSFDHFEEQREDNITFLNGLSLHAVDRSGTHPQLGAVTLEQVLNEWAFHDLGHIRQIAELVRAIRYYPEMGPFQTQYQIRP
jgi:hypothetical protein